MVEDAREPVLAKRPERGGSLSESLMMSGGLSASFSRTKLAGTAVRTMAWASAHDHHLLLTLAGGEPYLKGVVMERHRYDGPGRYGPVTWSEHSVTPGVDSCDGCLFASRAAPVESGDARPLRRLPGGTAAG
jgi:hypothetical protein